jgi:hypothetical protein
MHFFIDFYKILSILLKMEEYNDLEKKLMEQILNAVENCYKKKIVENTNLYLFW